MDWILPDADNSDEAWAEASVALAVEIADLEGWDWPDTVIELGNDILKLPSR